MFLVGLRRVGVADAARKGQGRVRRGMDPEQEPRVVKNLGLGWGAMCWLKWDLCTVVVVHRLMLSSRASSDAIRVCAQGRWGDSGLEYQTIALESNPVHAGIASDSRVSRQPANGGQRLLQIGLKESTREGRGFLLVAPGRCSAELCGVASDRPLLPFKR